MAAPNLKLEVEPPSTNGNGDSRVRAPAVSNSKKWVPKKWESLFDEWVLRSVLGASNIDIAAKYGYTKQHVSAVLNTPQAKLLKRQLHDNLRKGIELRTEERIAHMQDKAIARMAAVLDDDDLASMHPFPMFDRAMTLLKGTGVMKSDDKGGINAKNAIFMAPDVARGILEGMQMADKAKLLNAATGDSVEVFTTGKNLDTGKNASRKK